jgi:hypothetical protein
MTDIEFTDLSLTTSQLFNRRGPMNPNWVRVKFTIPDDYSAPTQVMAWLREEVKGQWHASYHQDPFSRELAYQMIVRFEDRNDALMFKLRDGYKAWEDK